MRTEDGKPLRMFPLTPERIESAGLFACGVPLQAALLWLLANGWPGCSEIACDEPADVVVFNEPPNRDVGELLTGCLTHSEPIYAALTRAGIFRGTA